MLPQRASYNACTWTFLSPFFLSQKVKYGNLETANDSMEREQQNRPGFADRFILVE